MNADLKHACFSPATAQSVKNPTQDFGAAKRTPWWSSFRHIPIHRVNFTCTKMCPFFWQIPGQITRKMAQMCHKLSWERRRTATLSAAPATTATRLQISLPTHPVAVRPPTCAQHLIGRHHRYKDPWHRPREPKMRTRLSFVLVDAFGIILGSVSLSDLCVCFKIGLLQILWWSLKWLAALQQISETPSSINEDRLWVYLASLWYEGPRKIVGRCESRPTNSRKSSAFCRTAYSPCAANKFTSLNLKMARWPRFGWCAWTRLDLGLTSSNSNSKWKNGMQKASSFKECPANAIAQKWNLPMIPPSLCIQEKGSKWNLMFIRPFRHLNVC